MSNTIRLTVKPNSTNGFTVTDYQSNHNTITGTNITIDWGDGTIDNYDGTISHTYTVEGTYNVIINGVSSIGNHFLRENKNIYSVKIDDEISSIGTYFLYNCNKLEFVQLPNNMTKLGDYFLSKCSSLKSLKLPDSLTSIESFCLIETDIEELEIPSSVTTINQKFLQKSSIKRIYFNEGLTTIKTNFLLSCPELEKIDLPQSVTTIGSGFLKIMGGGTGTMTRVTIPPNVTSIGGDFLWGNSVSIVRFEPKKPPTLAENINKKLIVDDDSISLYLEAPYYPKTIDSYEIVKTIETTTKKLGKLLANNLSKYVKADWREGLTTLSDKILQVGSNHHLVFENNISTNFNMLGTNGDSYTLTLPENVTELDYISYMNNLTELTIPCTVQKIREYAFYGQNNTLENIRFERGTPPMVEDYTFLGLSSNCSIEVPYGTLTDYTTTEYYPDSNTYTYTEWGASRLGNYGASIPFSGESTNRLQLHCKNQLCLKGSGGHFSGREIRSMHGVNNGRVRIKFRLTNDDAFNQLFICATNVTPSSTEETHEYCTRVRGDGVFQYFTFTNEETIDTGFDFSENWFYLEAIKDETIWTMNLYDENLNLLSTRTEHLQIRNGCNWYFGLQTEMNEDLIIGEVIAEPSNMVYWDSCTENNTSNYTVDEWSDMGRGSLTYNDDGYYESVMGHLGFITWKINNLTTTENVRISADFNMVTSANIQPKLMIFDETESKGYSGRLDKSRGRISIQEYTVMKSLNTDNGSEIGTTASVSTSTDTWYHLEFIVSFDYLTLNLYDENLTLMGTATATGTKALTPLHNKTIAIGMSFNPTQKLLWRNIKVEEI